jgi:hypothetical protein
MNGKKQTLATKIKVVDNLIGWETHSRADMTYAAHAHEMNTYTLCGCKATSMNVFN